jgi:catechol 2,3-dioxygenase-like lactoylglutathione lyase family enzyme
MEVLSSRVLIRPRDFERSRDFYGETLGLRVYREYGGGREVTGVVYFLGGGFLELTVPGPQLAEGGGGLRLWLQVPELAAEHERLVAAGAPIAIAPSLMPWGLWEMTVVDPDGVPIVLVEVPEGHPIRRRVEE